MANEFIVRKGLISIGGDVIINRDQGNYNFTIESPADSNLFVANYTNNNITIGNTASPNYKLGAWSTSSAYTIYSYNSNSSGGTAIYGIANGTGNENYAVQGQAVNANIQNFGGYFTTSGSQTNYAVKGEASDASANNYGGHFTAGNAFSSKGARSSYGIYVIANENTNSGNSYGGYFSTSYTGSDGNSYGIYIIDTSSGTGNADYFGIRVQMEGNFNIGTNNSYGIYVNNITSSGDNTYAIYTVNGDNYLNQGSGRTGIGIPPTALLTLKAGTSTTGTAPLKLTNGILLGTAEIGAVEYLTPLLYFTNGDAIRQRIPLIQFGMVTSGQQRLNDANYTNITGMSVELAAGGRYELEVYLLINSTSGTGARGRFAYTASLDQTSYFSYLINTNGNTIAATNRNFTETGTLSASEFVVTTLTAGGFFVKGFLDASTPGTLTFQGGQGTSTGTTMFFDVGSFIKVTQVT